MLPQKAQNSFLRPKPELEKMFTGFSKIIEERIRMGPEEGGI